MLLINSTRGMSGSLHIVRLKSIIYASCPYHNTLITASFQTFAVVMKQCDKQTGTVIQGISLRTAEIIVARSIAQLLCHCGSCEWPIYLI